LIVLVPWLGAEVAFRVDRTCQWSAGYAFSALGGVLLADSRA